MKQNKNHCELRNTQKNSNKCKNCIFYRTLKLSNGNIEKWTCRRQYEAEFETETYIRHLAFVIKQEAAKTAENIIIIVQKETSGQCK